MNSPHIVRKSTSPISAPPEAGIHWINTSTKEEFFSVGTGSINDWIKRSITRTADALETTVWNQTGVIIPAFSVVYINGSQGTYPTVALAQAHTEATSTGTYGVTVNAINNNSQGTVVPFGLVEGINTSAFVDGDRLWLSPTVAGGVTTTKPSAPDHIVFVGTVTRSNPSNGRIEVKISNGYELEELHNVAISYPTNGDTIIYNSSTQLWNNHTLTKSDIGLSNVDNTSDANKPISTATQAALNLKEDVANKSNSSALGASSTLYPTQGAVKSYVDTGLGTKQNTITGAATSITSTDLSLSKILVSNGSGKVAASSVDSANLNYLDATSSIQTQINTKANDADVLKKDGSVGLTGDLNLNTHKISNVVDPVSNQDAATKFYVDNLVSGLDWKQACHAATIANINLASAPATIDSHTLNSGDRVLVKDQSTASENGIYIFNGTGSAMTRSSDADTWNEIVGAVVYIEQGSTNIGSKWNCTNVSGGTLGVTSVNFTLFSSASSISGVGNANYNAYWTASNVLSSEQHVAQSRGGLGTDASSFTGVVKSSSGSFSASSIVDADISSSAAIDASKIGGGSVSNTEFGYLDGVSSSIQTQLNGKQASLGYTPVNKAGDTMTGPLIVSGSVSTGSAMMRVTNTGIGDCFIVEDAANPDASNFKIDSSGFVYTGSLLSSIGVSGRLQILDLSNSFVECIAGSTRAVSFGASTTGNGFRSSMGGLDISTSQSADAITIYPGAEDEFGPSIYTKSNGSTVVTGINNITPTEALDVTGNVKASGNIQAPSVKADTFSNKTDTSLTITTTEPSLAFGTQNLYVNSGFSTGNTGLVNIQSGGGNGTGSVIIKSGNSTVDPSGDVSLKSGTSGSGFSGSVTIGSGDAASDTGNVLIISGVSSGGNRGDIRFDAPNIKFNNWRLQQVDTPTSGTDAANKNYVDTGLALKEDLHFIPKLSGSETYRGYLYQNNSTTAATENISIASTNGTATARSVANTNALTKQVRMAYAVSTPAANAVCGVRNGTLMFSVGGGFRMSFSFAYTDSQYNSGALQFYGLHGTTGGITISSTASVSSILNTIGIGSDAGDSALSIFSNDGAGVATKVTLSASDFPANRTAGAASTDMFKVDFYNETGSSSVKYQVTNLTTGVKAQGTISSDLPASSTLLCFQAIRTSGSSSNACSMDLTRFGVYSIN